MSQTQKGFAPLVWVIITAILLGGGYAVYRNYQQPTTDNNRSLEVAETKDWKTYRNEKYGFEFQYPPGWFSKDNLYPYNEFSGRNQFLICLNPENVGHGDCYGTLSVNWPVSIQQWYDGFKRLYENEKGVLSVEESEVYVSGTEARLLSVKSARGFGHSAYWEYDNHVYDFKMYAGNEDVFFKILSTFKFTK
ncbi:MAG TPA: hypothetical protein DEF00_04180 [Candidatus Taylorbacteria bacterium]|nr:MAG: hypothetical protein UY29_C0011G0043 [Parcubacteria group bacterium GW2011_GWC2_48_17]HBV01553.1 hypothetical protein [Candidatus Taylorbacteria bacterium]